MRGKFDDIFLKVDSINKQLEESNDSGHQKFLKVQDDLINLQKTTSNVQTGNLVEVKSVQEDFGGMKEMLSSMKDDWRATDNNINRKLLDVVALAKAQRRKYKLKFLEVETETTRLYHLLETVNGIVKNMQAKLEEIDDGKRHNLIFHGFVNEHSETQER